jgi:hypothetical protein
MVLEGITTIGLDEVNYSAMFKDDGTIEAKPMTSSPHVQTVLIVLQLDDLQLDDLKAIFYLG